MQVIDQPEYQEARHEENVHHDVENCCRDSRYRHIGRNCTDVDASL